MAVGRVHDNPILSLKFPGKAILFEALRRTERLKMPVLVNGVGGAGFPHQGHQRFEGRTDQRRQGSGLSVNFLQGAGRLDRWRRPQPRPGRMPRSIHSRASWARPA
jgi:hypothetical protein